MLEDLIQAAGRGPDTGYCYRPLFLQFFVTNELKNLTNVVIGNLGKLVHKQNCSHEFIYIL
jgi:hypothetical protein